MSSKRTQAPLAANRCATARPMPLAAPVTTASLPSRRNVCEFPFRNPPSTKLLRLLLMCLLEDRQRVLRIGVVGRQLQRSAQFLLRLTEITGATIKQSEILVQ